MKVINDKTTDKDRQLLVNKIYELGYEVGYKNHSEVGWVMREYTRLINDALRLGIHSPESYYNDGKIRGKMSRDKGVGDFSEKGTREMSNNHVSGTGFNKANSADAIHSLKKPPFSDLPCMIERISMVEIPRLLRGFRLIQKK